MKRITLFILLLIGIGATAQDAKDITFKNHIKIAPFRMIAHTLAIGYERELTPTTHLYLLSQIIYSEESYDYEKGFVQDIGAKLHIVKGKEVLGFTNQLYFMPYLQYGSFDFQDAYRDYPSNNLRIRSKEKFQSYGGGLLMGWKLILNKRFYSDIYIGGGIRTNTLKPDEQGKISGVNSFWDHKGVVPKGGIEFGFTF